MYSAFQLNGWAERETASFDAVRTGGEEPSAVQSAAEEKVLSEASDTQEETPVREEPSVQDVPPVYDRPVSAAEDDYTDARRREEIAGTLKAMTLSLTLRAAIVGVLAFNALYFGLAAVVLHLIGHFILFDVLPVLFQRAAADVQVHHRGIHMGGRASLVQEHRSVLGKAVADGQNINHGNASFQLMTTV